MSKPYVVNIPSYYKPYVNLVDSDDPIQALKEDLASIKNYLGSISNSQASFSYEPKKWSIKQVIQHMIDAETIFAYRALRFARKDRTELSSFDDNHYAEQAKVEHLNIEDLVDHFEQCRKSSILLFKSFTQESLPREGISSGFVFSVGSMAFIMAGHVKHHIAVLKERYTSHPEFPSS